MHVKGAQMKTSGGALALHMVTREMATPKENAEIAKLLLEVYPQGAMVRNAEGWLAIHLVMRHMEGPFALQIAQTLLEAAPESARERNPEGWLPLQLAARHQGGHEGAEVIRMLMGLYPEAIKSLNREDYLPIHLACSNELVTREMIEVLVSAFPGALLPSPPGTTVANYKPIMPCAESWRLIPDDALEFMRRASQGRRMIGAAVADPRVLLPAARTLQC
jgi:hypothetical protein